MLCLLDLCRILNILIKKKKDNQLCQYMLTEDEEIVYLQLCTDCSCFLNKSNFLFLGSFESSDK